MFGNSMKSSLHTSTLDLWSRIAYLTFSPYYSSMHHKRFNILIASTLAAFFVVFNVGLPIALYVCPMMANERCTGACSLPATDGVALTFVHTSCCNHSVLAERNTVPFLGATKYEPPHAETMLVLTSAGQWAGQQAFRLDLLAMADTGPPPSDTPLYLFSASLLL